MTTPTPNPEPSAADIAQIQLSAWHKLFGTSQLSHAIAHKESLERELTAALDRERHSALDWAEEHTCAQQAALKAGIPKETVDGDSYGVPGIIELVGMLSKRIAELEAQLQATKEDSFAKEFTQMHIRAMNAEADLTARLTELNAMRTSRDELAECLEEWSSLTNSGLRLRCGEMTAQEIITVRAVLNAISSRAALAKPSAKPIARLPGNEGKA